MTRVVAPLSGWLEALDPHLAFPERARSRTRRDLRAASIAMFPEWYLALSYGIALVAGLVVAAIAGAAFALARLPHPVLLPVGLGISAFLLVQIGFFVYPQMRAAGRRKRIDADLAGVLLLAYALSQGGMGPLDIFRAIAEERRTYGEASREMALIVRDVDWFGLDVNTAIASAARTTPSRELGTFLDGLVTILNSGARPEDYFHRQAEVHLASAEVRLGRDLEQAGLLAEVYVSGLMVLPLLLIVILTVLSVLSGGASPLGPLLVFGLMPLGTIGYLVLVDTLLPAEPLPHPEPSPALRDDFGFDSLRQPERLVSPVDPHQILAALAALAAPVGWLLVGPWALLALLGIVPLAFMHEWRGRRARAVDAALPETLARLAGFNQRGIGLLQAFHLVGRNSSGPLEREMAAVSRDLRWNGSLRGALRRLRARVGTLRIRRAGVLMERASGATGDLTDVLSVAARDATITDNIRERRRGSMMSYLIVIYVVFGVFLFILATVASLFYGSTGLAAATPTGASGTNAGSARTLFYHAALAQGVCSGLVAGRLAEGYVLSGVKHAVVLAGLAWIVFQWMVFT